MNELRELEPDLAVVVAFGQIFRRSLLELPRHGCFNLHGSLLPRHRGAAPIQASLAAGETVTGVTTMQMDVGMDTGPILLMEEVPVGDHETAVDLAPRLADTGAALMVETLRRLERGELEPRAQDHSLATYAPRLAKADAVIDWRLEAREIYNRWRAYTPWPGLVSELRDEPLKVLEVRVIDGTGLAGREDPGTFLEPGAVLVPSADCLAVRAGSGTILGLVRVQRPGRQGISAVDFYHGQRIEPGERFRPRD